MSKTVDQILESHVKHVDLSIIAYLSNMLQEAINENHIFGESDIHITLFEGLKLYAICSNEDESFQLASNLFNDLIKYKHIKDPSIIKKEILKALQTGTNVMAQYSQDVVSCSCR